MRIHRIAFIIVFVTSCTLVAITQSKPKLTLDDFFNSVSFPSVEISPDGNAVVIAAERADWLQQIFRHDLWLYHDDGKGGSLIQLTQSGHDSEPKWSPDGRWIAFLSERKPDTNAGAAKPVVIAPASAVHDNAVFVLLDGRAVRRTVKTGATSGRDVRIEEGLIGGEDLITNPPAGLKDGDKVRQKV